MKIKITVILVFLFLFLGVKFAYAQVVINEVELNPTGERFIELYNADNSIVNLTGWYLQRKTQNGTDFGSLVSKTNFKSKAINPGGYFLISRSAMNNADIVLGDLTLTESNTIQIKNSKGTVIDRVSWGDINIPNPPDGKSIQRTSNSWIVTLPTPRAENAISASVPIASVPVVSNTSEIKTKIEIPKATKITTKPKIPIAETAPEIENPITDLTASPILSDMNNDNNSNNSYVFFLGLIALLIVSSGVVYFIRTKRKSKNFGDDFEILDK